MNGVLLPTSHEVTRWLLETVRHVCHVEYYLQELQVGESDPQRPHDIVGPGNKFQWNVLRGFAVQYRDRSPEFFRQHVEPSRNAHRVCQHHHRVWNQANPLATDDGMRLGAVDAVCSLLEPREYQGGSHTFGQIQAIARESPAHNQSWLTDAAREIQRIVPPRLNLIVSLDAIPSIGLSRYMHDIIRQRVNEARGYLTTEQRYQL